jgi:hypothetical protein
MTIEKTYKLTIKDTAYFLTEEEVTKLYEQCRKALNIDNATPYFPNYPPGVRKFNDDKTTPLNPTTPTIPYPYDTYPWYTPKYPNDTGTPYWTYGTIKAGEGICVKDTNWQPNLCNTVKSSNGINFLSDDMETIKENDKWRSSVQQALDKLSAKTNVTTSDGTTIK